jgi:hypothetical protein
LTNLVVSLACVRDRLPKPGPILRGFRKLNQSQRSICVGQQQIEHLNSSSATEELDHKNDQRNHKQEVNGPRDHVETDKTDQPKNQQNKEKRPQHALCLLI